MRAVLRSPDGDSTVSSDTFSRSLSRIDGSVILLRQPSPYSGNIVRMASVCRA